MKPILFTNIQVFDGMESFPGEVLVEGPRITRVARGTAPDLVCDGAQRIDGRGATLMPGLIESHAHLSFASSSDRIIRERKLPAEENLLLTAWNARVTLEAGFTSAYSAGSKGPRFEVALKKEIDGGYLPGPRLVASTFERPANVDKARSGPDELRRFVSDMAADGVQSIKLLLSGDEAFTPGGSLVVEYEDAEVAAVADQARTSGVWLAAHAQAAGAVKMAARHGFRIVYHCTHADEEALDMLEARKGDMFVAPAIGIIYAKAYLADAFGLPESVKQKSLEIIALNQEVYAQMKRRGIRILPGGDYGFPWNPIGQNARDLALFVKLFGWQPAEALHAATAGGAELMNQAHQLGRIQDGYLADLLLVRDDPLQHIERLTEPDNLIAVMQDGRFHKAPEAWKPLARAARPVPLSVAV